MIVRTLSGTEPPADGRSTDQCRRQIPLIVGDDVVGVLAFDYFGSRRPFTEAEMDFARKLAVSASLALENARLLESEFEQRLAAEQHAGELEATLDAISDGVVIYGLDGKILRQNVAAARMLGYQPSDRELSPAERRARLGAEMVDNPSAGIEQMAVSRALARASPREANSCACTLPALRIAHRRTLWSAARRSGTGMAERWARSAATAT